MDTKRSAFLGALALVLALVVVPNVAGAATERDVRVINTASESVPVRGAVAVSSLPPVELADNNVDVATLPPVQLADNTVRIDPAANTVRTAAVVTEVLLDTIVRRAEATDPSTYSSNRIDVAAFRQVRLSVTCGAPSGGSCGALSVLAFGDAGGPLYDLDQFTLGAENSATRLYELPGTGFWVSVGNIPTNSVATVTLVGRAN